jgi:hypothetical protein
MNNVFPNHPACETLGILVIERMEGTERTVMQNVSCGWKSLSERSTKICAERAAMLVDSYTDSFRESLKVSFVQRVDPGILSVNIQKWGYEMRENLLKIFKDFSQSELEAYTRDPEKSILVKGQALIQKNAKKITHLGAEILTDILFMKGDVTPSTWKPTSLIQSLVLQEITESSQCLIAGTIRRIEKIPAVEGFLEYFEVISKLNKKEVEVGLQSRLITAFSTSLECDYEATFADQELIQLYRMRSQNLYQTILKEIKRPLQLKTIAWITENGY